MRPFEQILINLDSRPWSAILRVALGFAVLLAFRTLAGGSDPIWMFSLIFVGLLIALRTIPAVLRHALPFSAEASAIWSDRRQIAKRYDSYQWQKLFWIGLGLLSYAVMGDEMRIGEIVVTAVCLAGGGAGLLLWHGVSAATATS